MAAVSRVVILVATLVAVILAAARAVVAVLGVTRAPVLAMVAGSLTALMMVRAEVLVMVLVMGRFPVMGSGRVKLQKSRRRPLVARPVLPTWRVRGMLLRARSFASKNS
jgi:hypothetical protein